MNIVSRLYWAKDFKLAREEWERARTPIPIRRWHHPTLGLVYEVRYNPVYEQEPW